MTHRPRWQRPALAFAAALLAGCTKQPDARITGYVEGDFLYLAPESGGWIKAIAVGEGDRVEAGSLLFVIDDSTINASLEGARSRVAEAQSQLADLRRGARPQRVTELEAQVAARKTALRIAQQLAERRRTSIGSGGVSQEQLEEAVAAADSAGAELNQAVAQLELESLPAREDLIEAAANAVAAAAAEVRRLETLQRRYRVTAPSAGSVQEVVRRRGEYVNPGAAVIAFLPDSGRRVKFFVPQSRVPRIVPGQPVEIGADGLGQPVRAAVTFISGEVEFSPPVLYHPEDRERLLVLIEARLPASDGMRLRPGQPVSVRLVEASGGGGDGE